MKMTTSIIIASVLVIGLIVFVSCKPKQVKESKTEKIDTNDNKENPFLGLRSMAFSATPQQLGLEIPDDKTQVYGIILDWDLGDAIATIVGFETGDASMYLSSGGGVIGGGQHDNVRNVVKPYIKIGQDYLEKAAKSDTTSLPDKNCIKFHFLTNKGIYCAQEQMTNIENETSDWLKLFEEANKVLTELRLISEKQQ
jgi:hypothetical protein